MGLFTDYIAYQELANALQSAHPKIQKMCEEESDDPEAVHKLLEINDSIHRTIERYKLVKKGDLDAASKIPKGTLGTTTGVSKNANNELSLIDFDPEPVPEPANGDSAGPSQSGGSALENDLLGLSLGEQGPASGGGISLGGPGKSRISVAVEFPASKTNLEQWAFLQCQLAPLPWPHRQHLLRRPLPDSSPTMIFSHP